MIEASLNWGFLLLATALAINSIQGGITSNRAWLWDQLAAAWRLIRLRRTCAQRLRLTCRLAPLAQERHFLFGALPPALSSMVLCRLDSTSLKALRTVSRKTRLSVSGHVQRLHLDSAGVRRFTYTPISLIFPSLRELCLGRDVGLRALQGLLAMGGLQQLQVLDMLDASRLASSFDKRTWKAFVGALPPRVFLRVNVLNLPGSNGRLQFGAASAKPTEVDMCKAIRQLIRAKPMVNVDLVGAVPLPGQHSLKGLQGLLQLRRLHAVHHPLPPWAKYKMTPISSLANLDHLILSLPDAEPLRPPHGQALMQLLDATKDLPYLELMSLPNSTLTDDYLPALAQLKNLRVLLVKQLLVDVPEPAVVNNLRISAARLPSIAGITRLVILGAACVTGPSVSLQQLLPGLQSLSLRAGHDLNMQLLPVPKRAAAAQAAGAQPMGLGPAHAATGQGGSADVWAAGQPQTQAPQDEGTSSCSVSSSLAVADWLSQLTVSFSQVAAEVNGMSLADAQSLTAWLSTHAANGLHGLTSLQLWSCSYNVALDCLRALNNPLPNASSGVELPSSTIVIGPQLKHLELRDVWQGLPSCTFIPLPQQPTGRGLGMTRRSEALGEALLMGHADASREQSNSEEESSQDSRSSEADGASEDDFDPNADDLEEAGQDDAEGTDGQAAPLGLGVGLGPGAVQRATSAIERLAGQLKRQALHLAGASMADQPASQLLSTMLTSLSRSIGVNAGVALQRAVMRTATKPHCISAPVQPAKTASNPELYTGGVPVKETPSPSACTLALHLLSSSVQRVSMYGGRGGEMLLAVAAAGQVLVQAGYHKECSPTSPAAGVTRSLQPAPGSYGQGVSSPSVEMPDDSAPSAALAVMAVVTPRHQRGLGQRTPTVSQQLAAQQCGISDSSAQQAPQNNSSNGPPKQTEHMASTKLARRIELNEISLQCDDDLTPAHVAVFAVSEVSSAVRLRVQACPQVSLVAMNAVRAGSQQPHDLTLDWCPWL